MGSWNGQLNKIYRQLRKYNCQLRKLHRQLNKLYWQLSELHLMMGTGGDYKAYFDEHMRYPPNLGTYFCISLNYCIFYVLYSVSAPILYNNSYTGVIFLNYTIL
jgi:hypothetical protein